MCGGDLDAEREGRTPVVVYGTVRVGAYGGTAYQWSVKRY